ncbi:hypothetical protein DCAR_0832277 [Daucus carota subsp. sativus]|uniref:Uncharacterized protein n=1 Tax=Daucus carota subsp. sativus TaxID=79200 RepID=A0A175YR62_DAUCS|nr:hypothetical protein DCAR_0832277 [Daucus carota subsp. sativus]
MIALSHRSYNLLKSLPMLLPYTSHLHRLRTIHHRDFDFVHQLELQAAVTFRQNFCRRVDDVLQEAVVIV